MPKIASFLLAATISLAGITSAHAQTFGAFGSQGLPAIRYSTSYSAVPRTPKAIYSGDINTRMIAAASSAERSAERRSTGLCWRYVKRALLKADAVSSYPQTAYARQAGRELTERYGFKKLRVRNPYYAPVGSVLVYGGTRAGHVEIRTAHGYVSDYRARRPCGLPFLGAYARVR